jgi:hypothetical protein
VPHVATRKFPEYLAALALSSLVWAATWQGLHVGGFPVLFPAAGVGVAYPLLRGGWRWVPLLAGACLGGLTVAPPDAALALGLTVFSPTLITWLLLAPVLRSRDGFGRMRDVGALVAAALAGSALVA